MRWLLGAILVFLAACRPAPSMEQQIIATMESMEMEAEQGRHFDFISHVADDFRGQQGAMERQDLQRIIIFQINRHRHLHAQLLPINIHKDGENTATAQFHILVSGGNGLLPENGQLYAVNSKWIRQDGEWLLQAANWNVP